MIQWLRLYSPNTEGLGPLPCQGTRSFMPQLKIPVSSVTQLRPTLFATPLTAARQASLSITNSQSLLKLLSHCVGGTINHLILCRPLLLLPPIPPSIRVFSNESACHIRWPKDWHFSITLSKEYSGLISFRIEWLDLVVVVVQGILKRPPQYCKLISLQLR